MPLGESVEKNNDSTHWYPPAKSAIESLMREESVCRLFACAIAEGRWSDAVLRLMPDAIAALSDATAARDFASIIAGFCVAKRSPVLFEDLDEDDANAPEEDDADLEMRDDEEFDDVEIELNPQEEEALLHGENLPPREKFDDITKICLRDIFAQRMFGEGEMERLFLDRDRYRTSGLLFEDIESELVIRNMRLVVSVARHYVWRCSHLSLMDLIQEGTIGLMKAVERFEVGRGYKFSTYAWNWIGQKITRLIVDTDTTIRLPVHVAEKVTKVVRARTRLMDMREIADIPVGDIAVQAGFTSGETAMVLNATKIARTVSLATPTGEKDRILQDMFSDEHNVEMLSLLMDEELADAVAKVLASLPEREEKVLRMRYGIGGGEAMTLEEVGQVFHLTRERIRQIQVKAGRRFRHRFKTQLRSHS